jgi:hypothetical protein
MILQHEQIRHGINQSLDQHQEWLLADSPFFIGGSAAIVLPL